MSPQASDVITLLGRSRDGDPEAIEKLHALVDGELRRLARLRLYHLRRRLRHQGREPSLLTTDLVNAAFLSLAGNDREFANRAHFVAIAAHHMRSLCRDYARRALAAKRGGRAHQVALDTALALPTQAALDPLELIELDRALERLSALDERQAQVVELRFFGGLTDAEAAEAMGISESTVRREWRSARAWLRAELAGSTRL